MSKLVFISGGSRGIGAGLARAFADDGYRVALSYCHHKQAAEALAKELGERVEAFKLDQADPQSVKRCLSAVEAHFGTGIDVLINNGAIAQEKPFAEISPEDFSHMLDTNLRGPFLLAQACIPSMIDAGFGRIINIGSIGGQWGGFNQVHYAAAKAGLINLTQSIAKIYSGDGIRANTISIGLVATEMTANELDTQAGKEKVAAIPVGRLGTAEDIGGIALFLASPKSDYLSGQTINANGGMYFG
ncbi:SDR family NAD(P)-dependent oxidoreductase [Shewanella marisflavi]|uniref:SDR family NAD(P)-dependent oxidoreductase n=1 Tax=Shewanella marisflavi TaxID=260364 RepID=UPI00200BEC5D|nr:3-oxoacyl-ACP reductase family protein [Shewanella marisflavi]MCL1040846.1 3-oxoacyl-ACP reductase FabG [Shewanella marisflavi]